jgi:type IV pilus assembly protein PilF
MRMRIMTACLAVLGIAACSATGSPPAPEDGQGAQTAIPAEGRRDVVPGTGEETDARRRARIRTELAAGYYQQGSLKFALDELGQAVRADPRYAPAFGMLGLVYMDMGDRSRAEESFRRALAIAPDDADLNNSYGWFLCQTGREKQSIAHFERALKDPLFSTPAKPLHNAGICSLRMGDAKAAEDYFQRAFQVDATNPVAMYNLGVIFLTRGELDKARFHSQRLITRYDPTAQTLWLALRVERALGNSDAEASLALQLRRRFPGSPEAGLLAAGRYSD